MSDEKKEGLVDKAVKIAAIAAGLAALVAILPQDEIVKDGLPALWDAIKGVVRLGWYEMDAAYEKYVRPRIARWWKTLKRWTFWWILVSFVLAAAGIVTGFWWPWISRPILAVSAISILSFVILLEILSEGLVLVLYAHLWVGGAALGKVASVVGVKVPQVDEKKLQWVQDRLKFILASGIVIVASLFLYRHSPSWSHFHSWLLPTWAGILLAYACMRFFKEPVGRVIRIIYVSTLIVLGASVIVFVFDGFIHGQLDLDAVPRWILAWNTSEVIIVILCLPTTAILLQGAFQKEKADRHRYWLGAFCAAVVCFTIGCVLYKKGVITAEEFWGKSPTTAQTVSDDAGARSAETGQSPQTQNQVPSPDAPAPVLEDPFRVQSDEPAEPVPRADELPPVQVEIPPPEKERVYETPLEGLNELSKLKL